MLTMFDSTKNHKPIAKAIHAFDGASTAKWVPINKSFITLTKIILRAATERLHIVNVAITLRCIMHQGYRHLVLANDDQDLYITAFGTVEEFIISSDPSIIISDNQLYLPKMVSIPINYQQQRLGYIIAQLGDMDVNDSASSLALDEVAKGQLVHDLSLIGNEIVAIIRRYETRYRAIFIYGDKCFWIGNSSVLRQLDSQIHQFAQSIQPILIRGNKGTGKNIAARTLHCLRHAAILPFIESSCEEWQEGAAASILQALYTYAKGGTLFLRNVDKLSFKNFCALEQFWSVRAHELAKYGFNEAVGLILTVTHYNFVRSPLLTEWFASNVVELCLPDLSERREDIRDLARFFMHEYALSLEFDFSEEAWELLDNFYWQDNVEQLKNIIQKVALRVDEPVFSAASLRPLLFSGG